MGEHAKKCLVRNMVEPLLCLRVQRCLNRWLFSSAARAPFP